jgi:hypothetical protein
MAIGMSQGSTTNARFEGLRQSGRRLKRYQAAKTTTGNSRGNQNSRKGMMGVTV